MNHLRKALTLVVFIGLVNIGQSQNCYEVIADMSGFDTSPYQAELEASACELKDAFPAEFQDQIKVYDFGFNSQNEFMQGGFQAVWDKVLSEIPTDYYLIFGKQTDRTGIYTKFWFDMKLPDQGHFSCLTTEERNIIYDNMKFVLNSSYDSFNRSPFNYAQCEILTINRLKLLVEEIVNCCDPSIRTSCSFCIPSDDIIQEYLQAEGFTKIDLSFEIGGIVSAREKQENAQKRSTGDYVTDYTNFEILIDGELIDVEDKLEAQLDNYAHDGNSPKFFIIKNSNLCDGTYELVRDQVNANLPEISGTIYIRDDISASDEMYAVVYGVLNEELEGIGAYSIGELNESTSNSITSFQELVDAVKESEDSLIIHGYDEIEDRIHMIRGIYYGTTWSMDYGQMGSDGRNDGFNYFTASPEPLDPRPFIGDDLFNLLVNSPEVSDNGKSVDWGHAIIGIDARRKYASRSVNFPIFGSTGLEMVTWIGDIGGGAGKLAWDRINSPNTRAKSKFLGSHFGGPVNLEGDLAAYLIGRDGNPTFSAPDMS